MAKLDEFTAATRRAAVRRATEPFAVAARYDRRRNRIVVSLSTGLEFAFPPHIAQGLEKAKPDDLTDIEISPSGFGIHFPKLDAHLHLPAMLQGYLARSRGWRPNSAPPAVRRVAPPRRLPRAPMANEAADRAKSLRDEDRVRQAMSRREKLRAT
jgi:hypothetical protein